MSPKPSWYRTSTKGPDSFTQVKISTHTGRLQLGYLTLSGKNWRNGRAPSNATLEGFNPKTYVDLTIDTPDYVTFIVKSKGELILARNGTIAEANASIKDPRKHADEWIRPPDLSALTPVQIHHATLVLAMVLPLYDWAELPPYITEDGKPPFYMRPRVDDSRHDSGDDEFDDE